MNEKGRKSFQKQQQCIETHQKSIIRGKPSLFLLKNLNIWTLANPTFLYRFICLKDMIARLWIKTNCHQNISKKVTVQNSMILF